MDKIQFLTVKSLQPLIPALLLALLSVNASADTKNHAADAELGKVSFPISCTEPTQAEFEQGLALLHHMMYIQAEEVFDAAAEVEPDCAMLHWGTAMTNFHPLWGGIQNEQEAIRGAAAIQRAQALEAGTEREAAYINAAAAFYDGAGSNYGDRLSNWAAKHEALYTQYPEDTDAVAFYALSQLAIAPKDDKTKQVQRHVGDVLQAMAIKAPEHPAGYHYLIHAYDTPTLAEQGLDASRGYDKLAPSVAHALHMPSHIFVRRGLWDETIDWNERSATAAMDNAAGGTVSGHYAHAMDYLIYAHLQRGETEQATRTLNDLFSVADQQDAFVTAYGIAAAAARVALEQEKWADAATLPVKPHAAITWDKFPAIEAITEFARGIGAARSGDVNAAQKSTQALQQYLATLEAAKQSYWATLARSQLGSVEAWVAFAEGDQSGALKLMQAAADLEDSVDKHPVTPSAVLPARELLGDMLNLSKQHESAIAAYDAALSVSPNRARSLKGALIASVAIGDDSKVTEYTDQLNSLEGSIAGK